MDSLADVKGNVQRHPDARWFAEGALGLLSINLDPGLLSLMGEIVALDFSC